MIANIVYPLTGTPVPRPLKHKDIAMAAPAPPDKYAEHTFSEIRSNLEKIAQYSGTVKQKQFVEKAMFGISYSANKLSGEY